MKALKILMSMLIVYALSMDLPAAATEDNTFKEEELDQMLAPIALYPDSLLAQVLMAATYPADVIEAAKWSKANPDQKGDAAVNAVADQPWDPSVKSLVAFPQVLAMMGAKPDDVQRLGDAFLAQPSQVMDRVQFLRDKAQEAGNLETNEQQTVSTQADGGQSVIVIEPAQPQTVYVPVYQPTVVYGAWWYPAYPPYYWAPPPYYYPGGAFVAGVVWGAAIVGIHNSLWGGCHWGHGHGSVNINVNRYNNINVNNRITNVNSGNTNWNHNAANRKGVPYRDEKTRQQYDRKVAGAENRADFRGRDPQRDASREKAQATLANRGIDPAKGREQLRNDPQTRERAQTAAKNVDRDKTRAAAQNIDRDKAQAKAQNVDRDRARQNAQARSRDNALKGAGNPGRTRQNIDRGNASRQSMQRHGGGARQGGGRRRG